MDLRIGDVLVHYVEHGGGVPLVALHGAGVDHRDIEAAIEPFIPRVGYCGSIPICREWAARQRTA
jgi:hypothetical protein